MTTALSPAIDGIKGSTIGATASELSGGKFVNGAVSGAFGYMMTRSLEDPSTDDPLEESDFGAAEMQELIESSPYAAGGESIEIAQNSITRKFEIGIGGGVGRGGGGGSRGSGRATESFGGTVTESSFLNSLQTILGRAIERYPPVVTFQSMA